MDERENIKGDVVHVGMMQLVSLNIWSHEIAERLWASNVDGQQSF